MCIRDSFSEVGVTNGLINYWKFNNEVQDWAGSYNGSITGSPTYTAGIKGYGLEFDNNSSDYVTTGDIDLTDAITLSCLVYIDALTATYQMFVSKGYSSSWALGVSSSGNFRFYLTTTSGYKGDSYGSGTAGNWYHLVLTYDNVSETCYRYVNGVGSADASFSGDIATNDDNVYIGRGVGASYPVDGIIDEVRIYNRALSASEIKQLYNLYLGDSRMLLSENGQTYIRGELRET